MKTISIMTLSTRTFDMKALRIKTLCAMTFNIMTLVMVTDNDTQ